MDVTTKAVRVAAAAAWFVIGGSGALYASEGIIGAQVKAQIWAEQGLRQNDYYLKTLNPAVSNYGTASQKAAFKRAVNHQVQARVHFLSFKFAPAYEEVRRSQYLMIQLYEDIVEASRETTQARVIKYADRIVHSRNVKLKKYLTLGLRALESARLNVQNEYNIRPWLYILRLDNLADAIKQTREAERYAMLVAIDFESIYPKEDSGTAGHKELAQVISSGFTTTRGEMILRNDDNFFKVGQDQRDLLEEYWTNPDLEILKKPLPGWADEPDPAPVDRI